MFTVKKRKTIPVSLLYSGRVKIGKTTKLTQLPKNLMINLERSGSDYLKDINVIDCSNILNATPKEIDALLISKIETKVIDLGDIPSPIDRHKALTLVLSHLVQLGRPYDYVSIDTITQADTDAEWAGTDLYMNSNQGKTFNRVNTVGKPTSQWPILEYGDTEYESVIEGLGQNGWRWSRTIMVNLMNLSMQAAAKCIIYVCHIKDKLWSKSDKDTVMVKDIALTGAVADIYSRNVAAIGHVYRDEDNLIISFKGNEERSGGNRADIGSYEGIFDWDKIFDLEAAKTVKVKNNPAILINETIDSN